MRVAAAVVLMLVLSVPAQGAPSPRRASLKLESLAPLVVSGRQFGVREPVLVTYLAADQTRRVVGVRSKRNGSFEAPFDLRLDRCAVFTVRAAGLRGSRAVLQVEPACKQKDRGPPKRAPAIVLEERKA
ncbi:MAG TPA: hypothetical protein VNP89_07345 [Gaiellaceae bacterium]|nr:hypothetical protein [Gaiellaceae bacterium]